MIKLYFNIFLDRLWFLRPIRDQTVLKQRHDAVSFFITPRNMEVVSALSDNLKYVRDIEVDRNYRWLKVKTILYLWYDIDIKMAKSKHDSDITGVKLSSMSVVLVLIKQPIGQF